MLPSSDQKPQLQLREKQTCSCHATGIRVSGNHSSITSVWFSLAGRAGRGAEGWWLLHDQKHHTPSEESVFDHSAVASGCRITVYLLFLCRDECRSRLKTCWLPESDQYSLLLANFEVNKKALCVICCAWPDWRNKGPKRHTDTR